MALSFLAVALADMATFPLEICFHFIMHLVRASWQQTFHLYHNTCCRCDPQSAAENATNTGIPRTPSSPVKAGKVLGRVVSANARNTQDSSIKILKAIYLNVKLFKTLFLSAVRC